MNIFDYNQFINEEAINFFEKGKFWILNGKKCKVVGSIPQNSKVLKLQEVDELGKPIGKIFVGNKGEVKSWKETKMKNSNDNSLKDKEDIQKENPSSIKGEPSMQEEVPVIADEKEESNPAVDKRYKELVLQWKESQKKLGKNTNPGEGTRIRLLKQAQSEINFDETKDIESDIKSLSKRPAYDAVDRVSSLIKSDKIKSTKNVVKYLDFIKTKMQSGNVSPISMN